MKLEVILNLIAIVCLLSGFVLFLWKGSNFAIVLTLIGVAIYIYNKFKFKK